MDFFPEYFTWKNAGNVVPPWPVTDEGDGGIERIQSSGRRTLIQDCSSPAFLAWALAHEVELWAPTPAAFASAGAKLDELERERMERAADSLVPTAAGPKRVR
jgi:hypothetical protein